MRERGSCVSHPRREQHSINWDHQTMGPYQLETRVRAHSSLRPPQQKRKKDKNEKRKEAHRSSANLLFVFHPIASSWWLPCYLELLHLFDLIFRRLRLFLLSTKGKWNWKRKNIFEVVGSVTCDLSFLLESRLAVTSTTRVYLISKSNYSVREKNRKMKWI